MRIRKFDHTRLVYFPHLQLFNRRIPPRIPLSGGISVRHVAISALSNANIQPNPGFYRQIQIQAALVVHGYLNYHIPIPLDIFDHFGAAPPSILTRIKYGFLAAFSCIFLHPMPETPIQELHFSSLRFQF
jgi:hypothetical protein